MKIDSSAGVNEDGQVVVSTAVDDGEPSSTTASRAQSRAFAVDCLSRQGADGEAAAVVFLHSRGWECTRRAVPQAEGT